MNFIKRALLSVWNRKGNTILLIIVFSVLATLVFGGIVFDTAAKKEIDAAKKSVGASVTLKTKPIRKRMGIITRPLRMDTVKKIDKIGHVKSYNMYDDMIMKFDNVKYVGSKEEWKDVKKECKGANVIPADAELIGVSDVSKLEVFNLGGYRLISGRYILPIDKDKHNIMIEKELADKNHLKTGRKIILSTAEGKPGDIQLKTQYKIVGIYETPEFGKYITDAPLAKAGNMMFTSYSNIAGYNRHFYHNDYPSYVTYYLNDPSQVQNFIMTAKKELNMKKYVLQTDDTMYREYAGPLESTVSIMNLAALIIIIAAVIITALIMLMQIRERRREIGIMMAIGEKHIKIVSQLFLEILIPVLIAVCVGFGLSSIVSDLGGNFILGNRVGTAASQTKKEQEFEYRNIWGINSHGSDPSNDIMLHTSRIVKPKSTIKIDLNLFAVAKCVCAILVLLLAAVAVPAAVITRLQPKDLLSKK